MTSPGGPSVEQTRSLETKERLGISAISFEGLVFLVHNLDCADEQEKKQITNFAFDSGAYHLLLTHFKLLDDGRKQKVACLLLENIAIPAIFEHAEVLTPWLDWGKVFDVLTERKDLDWDWYNPEPHMKKENGIKYGLLFQYRSLFEPIRSDWYRQRIQQFIEAEDYIRLFELSMYLVDSDSIPWLEVFTKARKRLCDLRPYYPRFRTRFPKYAEKMAFHFYIQPVNTEIKRDNSSEFPSADWSQYILPWLEQRPIPYKQLSDYLPRLLRCDLHHESFKELDWNRIIRHWVDRTGPPLFMSGNIDGPYSLLPFGNQLAALPIDWNQLAKDYQFSSHSHYARNRIGLLLCIARQIHLLPKQYQAYCEQSLLYVLQLPNVNPSLSWKEKDPLSRYDFETCTSEDQKKIILTLFSSHQVDAIRQICEIDSHVKRLVVQIVSASVPDIEWVMRLKVLKKNNLERAAANLGQLYEYLFHVQISALPSEDPKTEDTQREPYVWLVVNQRVATYYLDQLLLAEKQKVTQAKLAPQPSPSTLWSEEQEFSSIKLRITEEKLQKQLQTETLQRTHQFFAELQEYLLCAIDHELRNQFAEAYHDSGQELQRIMEKYFSTPVQLWSVGQALFATGKSAEKIQEYLLLAESQFINSRWRVEYGGKKWALIAEVARSMWKPNITVEEQIVAIDRCLSIEHNKGAIFDKDDRVLINPSVLKSLLHFCFKNNSFADLVAYLRLRGILPETELREYEQRFAVLQRLGSPQTPTRAAGYE